MSLQCKGRGWLIGKLRKASRALSRSDWLLIMQASGLLLAVELGLKLVSFKTLMALLQGRGSVSGEGPSADPVNPERVAYLVEVASRYHMLKPTCLKKALVLYGLLRRRGIEVDLVVGVRKAEGRLEGHAWVKHDGQVIGGGPVGERYTPLHRFEGGEALARTIRRLRRSL